MILCVLNSQRIIWFSNSNIAVFFNPVIAVFPFLFCLVYLLYIDDDLLKGFVMIR